MNFKSITYKDLGIVAARVNFKTGALELNSKTWNQLPFYFQHFVLLHEYGHYLLKSDDEAKASAYALENYVSTYPGSSDEALLCYQAAAKVVHDYLNSCTYKKSVAPWANIVLTAAIITGIISLAGIGSQLYAMNQQKKANAAAIQYTNEQLAQQESATLISIYEQEKQQLIEKAQAEKNILIGGIICIPVLLLLIIWKLSKSGIL